MNRYTKIYRKSSNTPKFGTSCLIQGQKLQIYTAKGGIGAYVDGRRRDADL